MHILSHLQLRTKLAFLMGLCAVALIVSIAVASHLMYQRMIDDRLDKLRAVGQSALGVAESLDKQIALGMTREQAIEQLRKAVHAIHFDAGAGYVVAQSVDPDLVIAHGGNPDLEGKPSPAKDVSGRSLTDLIREALGSGNAAVVAYRFPRPGETQPLPKVSYIARFAPWNIVFVVGAFTDDLDGSFRATIGDLAAAGGVILVATLLAAWLVNRDISGSLGRLRSAMKLLADGKLNTDIPGTARRDEVGGMAKTVLVFKEYMNRVDQLATEQAQDREQAEASKQSALLAMAETIEMEAKQALSKIGTRTAAMTEAANRMSESATRTGASAQSAAGSAAHALANAQTVASAAEQLSASIREIGAQVGQSSTVVGRAVEAGRVTRETIAALNEQVGRIGTVADMIGEIAARTNLLALNATIEAARAGDAGKGFAVVASEVKQLATQTARSTEEISRHIADVRSATGASVTAVGQIEATISEINAIAGSIAAAVEQQGAATAEIARNVSETASAANEMTSRATEVSAEAAQTGRKAGEVLENTAAMDAAMQDLHKSVIHLVRTSTSEVDRRRFRRRACLAEVTLTSDGRSETAALHDISERGCRAVTTLRSETGHRIDVALTRFGLRAEGRVIEQCADGLHIAFVGDGLPSAEVDRISLSTVAELMRLAKSDHEAFVKRVADTVTAGDKLPPNSLPTAHHCRFGRWYDNVSDREARELAPFKAIKAPHEAVHDLGRRALGAVTTGEMAEARQCVEEMRAQAQHVVRCLDDFARDYPSTIHTRQAA